MSKCPFGFDQDWDTRVSLTLPEFYNSARSVTYLSAGVTVLWILSRIFGKKEEPKKEKKKYGAAKAGAH